MSGNTTTTDARSLAELEAELGRVQEDLRALHDGAGERPLTRSEQGSWDRLERDRDDLLEAIEAKRTARARVREFSNRSNATEGSNGAPEVMTRGEAWGALRSNRMLSPEETRSSALRAVEAIADELGDEPAARLEGLARHDDEPNVPGAGYILAASNPAYEGAFRKHLADPQLGSTRWTEEEREAANAVRTAQEMRAMSVGTDADGGFAVPVQLDATVLLTSDGSVNPLRRIARVETITTKEWQGVSSAGVTASYAAESAEATDDSPTLSSPTVTPERAHVFVPFSFELGQDWSQARSELTRLIAESKDDLEAEKFVNGAGPGSNEPEGIVAGLDAASKVDTATTATFAAEDVYELDNDLPERFRPRARFLGNKVIYNDIRQFASSDGHDLWARIGDGRPPQILGYPAHESSAMDSDSGTSGQEILLLGDFQRGFLIVDRIGMSIEVVPHVFGASQRPVGQRGLYAFWRNSSVVLVDEAFRLLNVAA